MARPFKPCSQSNIAQLIEGSSSYSVRCNIQNTAERNMKQPKDGHISIMQWNASPMSRSVFLPTALFMFQPLNKQVDLFFRRATLVLFLWQLWKLQFEPSRPNLLLFAEASPKRVDVEMCLKTARQLPVRNGARGFSTQSASLPWRSAASKTPAM